MLAAVPSWRMLSDVLTGYPTIGNTVGALFLGWGISSIAFGMFCLQAWAYFNTYVNDPWGTKTMVIVIWVTETIHQIIIAHTCWHYTVSDYGRTSEIFYEKALWSTSTVVMLGALIGTIVKVYFGLRAYKLSKGKLYAVVGIWVMSVAQFALAVAFGVKTLKQSRIFEMIKLKDLGSISLGLGAATDIVTALVLSYYLHTMRTGFQRSDTLINRLIMFSVNTGALTSACSLSVLIVFQIMPTNFVFVSLYFLLCKLYSISCLATLNSRNMIAARGTSNEESAASGARGGNVFALMPRGSGNTPSKEAGLKSPRQWGHLAVGVRQEISVMRDKDAKEIAIPEFAYTHPFPPELKSGSPGE